MLFINIDASALDDLLDLGGAAQRALDRAGAELTAATRAKITELAQSRLHSRRNMYLDGLSHFQVDDSTWVVNLDSRVRWIDDGQSEHSMLDDLLKSKKAKRAKDGSVFVVVPFQHNKVKQDMTPAQQSLLQTVKKELAKVGATPNKIETHSDGTPKLGLVRSLDITSKPVSKSTLRIGAGRFGDPAQGPTGIPLLKGVRVYQREVTKKDGSKGVGRFVMTFRVASSKHRSQDRWRFPGIKGVGLMEEGLRWALDTWEQKIAPDVLARVVAEIS